MPQERRKRSFRIRSRGVKSTWRGRPMTDRPASLCGQPGRPRCRPLWSTAAFILLCVSPALPLSTAEASENDPPKIPSVLSGTSARALRELAAWNDEQVAQMRRRAELGDAGAQVEMGLM